MAEMTREDAERICKAHEWRVHDWDDYEGAFVKDIGWLLPEVLRALDPDRPPTLAQLRRLWRGVYRDGKTFFQIMQHGLTDDEAKASIADAWKRGEEDASS